MKAARPTPYRALTVYRWDNGYQIVWDGKNGLSSQLCLSVEWPFVWWNLHQKYTGKGR